MAYERNTVVGVFEDRDNAQRAVADLKKAGFQDDHIGLASHERATTDTGEEAETGHAGTGAVTGALAGAGVGVAWGIAVAAGLLPGIGPVIAGGALAAILASTGVGAAIGGIAGALIGLGVPEEEASYYESEFKAGRTLVTVKAENRYNEALAILRRHGGHAQERTGSFVRREYAATATGAAVRPTATPAPHTAASGEKTIQLREEQLHAEKQPVKAGEVHVSKEVVTEHKTMEVPVKREEVVIERHPVSGNPPATGGEIRPGEEVRIPVREEEVRVEKTPVVKEEVTVGKRTVQDTERVSGTVKKEEVKVEEKGDVKRADERNRP